MDNIRGNFNTSLGFIIACIGSAVGIGNVWLFPWRVGQFGGAIFLILYFFFICIFGVVGLVGEFTLGRMSKTGPMGAFKKAFQSKNMKWGKFLGIVPVIGSLGIAIGYSVVVAWIIRYTVGSMDGSLLASVDMGSYFDAIAGDFGSLPWHVIAVALCVFILLGGVSKGIELANIVMMPLFYLLFFILLIRVLTLPNIAEGITYLLSPDYSVLSDPQVWAVALGQAFFSLSLAGGGMVVYGSYLKEDVNIPNAAVQIMIFSSLGALLCAFVVIPAVFAFGISPNAGPPLLFISLPLVFQQMPFGYFFSILFFISVLFASLSSLINLMECPIEALQERGMPRNLAVMLVSAIVLGVGIFIENGNTVGRWMDIVATYIVPMGGVLAAITLFWVIRVKAFRTEVQKGMKSPLPKRFDFISKYLYVGITILILFLSMYMVGL